MLNQFQLWVALSFFVGDVLVIRAYVGPKPKREQGEDGGERKRYPKRSFLLHVLGGLGALVFGALALVAYTASFGEIAQVAARGQGLAVIAFAGLFALPMSRHTSGFEGFNLVGYVTYTIAWIASGLMLLWAPSVEGAYACFVLTHAYLTCRMVVWLVERGGARLLGEVPSPKLTYSVATTIAALIPLVLAWGRVGLAWHLGSVMLAIALDRLGISSAWHATHARTRR